MPPAPHSRTTCSEVWDVQIGRPLPDSRAQGGMQLVPALRDVILLQPRRLAEASGTCGGQNSKAPVLWKERCIIPFLAVGLLSSGPHLRKRLRQYQVVPLKPAEAECFNAEE